MVVLKFEIKNKNYFYHNKKRFTYFVFRNNLFVLEDKCKHRGGPLSLGVLNEDKISVTCPWHKMENCSIELKKKIFQVYFPVVKYQSL